MSVFIHHAIVVTSCREHLVEWIAAKATELGCMVIGPSPKASSDYVTMLVCPDGGKEGGPVSDAGDERRALFMDYLDAIGGSVEWCEVRYSDDVPGSRTERSAWAKEGRY